MQIEGLTPNTADVFHRISQLPCLRPFTLVGGTALSLQIGTRQSEDLDFMSWITSPKEKRDVQWHQIAKELSTVGTIDSTDVMGFEHVEFRLDGVKLSFYASDKRTPVETAVQCLNNIKLADITSIGAMKMEVMMRRSVFRDYYDIYSILKEGISIETLIDKALKYSGHRLKSKSLLAMLTDGSRFAADAAFSQLAPKYDVTAQDIEHYLRHLLTTRQGGNPRQGE